MSNKVCKKGHGAGQDSDDDQFFSLIVTGDPLSQCRNTVGDLLPGEEYFGDSVIGHRRTLAYLSAPFPAARILRLKADPYGMTANLL